MRTAHVSEQLRRKRLNDGLTANQLAGRLGVTGQTIRRIERSEVGAGFSPRVKKAVADYLEQRVTDLWPIAENTTQESHA